MHNMFSLAREKCNASLSINFKLMHQSVQIVLNGVIDYGVKIIIICWFSLCMYKLILYNNLNPNIITYHVCFKEHSHNIDITKANFEIESYPYSMFHELLVIIFTSTNWKWYERIWIRRNFCAHNLHFIQHCNVIISITTSVAVYQGLFKDRLDSMI